MGDVIPPSTTLAFVTKTTQKHKFTSPSANQLKNQQKTISIEEKLDAVYQLKNGEWIIDICHNVRFTHISICTVSDDGITESAKSGSKVFV